MFYLVYIMPSQAAAQDHSKNAWLIKKSQQKPHSSFLDALRDPGVTKK